MPARTTLFLLTGVTGGLGAKILDDMLHQHNINPRDMIATSRRNDPQVRKQFEDQGLQFRVADYIDLATLEQAFQGVENLLFMSSSTRDSQIRNKEHFNVIEAAKRANVKKVWYVSLAFGGFGDTSKIGFQAAHYVTETLLKESGLDFVNLRAGVYSDAFPLFLNWYPDSREVLMPKITPAVSEGKIAFASRDELGEAMATLLAKGLNSYPSIQPKTDKNIILLTSTETASLVDLVGAINRGRGTNIPVRELDPRDWIEASATYDEGGKTKPWFEARLVFAQGVSNGDAEVTDPALATFLGRHPETGVQTVERLVRENPQYRWHQNHVGASHEKYFGKS